MLSRSSLAALAATASACAAVALTAPAAQAGIYLYQQGYIGAKPATKSDPYVWTYTTATGAAADSSSHSVMTAAQYANGTQYANYTSAGSSVCHSYAGNQSLGGRMMNNNSVAQNPASGFTQYNGVGC